MPELDDGSEASLTFKFVVGNPKSDLNRSRIRSHASRAARRPVDAGNVSIHSEPEASAAASTSSDRAQQIETSTKSIPDIHSSRYKRHPWLPDFCHAPPRSWDTTEPSHKRGSSSPNLLSQSSLKPASAKLPFSTQGSTVGTWWERYPDAQSGATDSHLFDPHKRARLVPPVDEVGEPASLINRKDESHLVPVPKIPSSPACEPVQQDEGSENSRHLKIVKTAFKSQKVKRSAQRLMQGRWRLAAAPAKTLALSPWDPHAQLEAFLLQTSNFYESEFENTWKVMLQQDSGAFESPAHAQQFEISATSAAALVEAGRLQEASNLVQSMFEVLPDLVHRSNHPSAYYLFINFSLTTTCSALAQLYENLRNHLTPISEAILGPAHPITGVLRLRISDNARKQFHSAAMTSIRDMFYRAFGPDALQTMVQHLILGMILTKMGSYQEAIDELSTLLHSAERCQPLNSLFPVHVLLAKIAAYLAAGDSSIVPELHLNDAFRRLQIIAERVERLQEESEEKQMMETPMTVCQIVGLRALGRLQCLRRNFGAAIQAYSQAVHVGVTVFGPYAVLVHLAQADLDATKLEELKHSLEGLSLVSADSKAPPQPSEYQFHVARTAVGTIRAMNKTFMGTRTEHIPTFPGLVVGYNLQGGPLVGESRGTKKLTTCASLTKNRS